MQKPGVEGKAGQVPSGLGSGAQSASLGRKGWGAAPLWAGLGWIGCRGVRPWLQAWRRGGGVSESPVDPASFQSAQTS